MSTAIQPFTFEGREVRVQVDDAGEPWFCAADACRELEIEDVGTAVGRLDDDEKAKKIQPRFQNGGVAPDPAMWFVTEPGLFRLVLASRKPEAKRFQRWVTHEVLPAIRRTGSYCAPEPESEDALVLRAFGVLQNRVKVLQAENRFLQAANADLVHAKEEAAPKVTFVDRYVGAARGLIGLQQLAKQLHQPERKFVEWLRSAGYLYRDGDGTLVPRAEYGPTGSHLFEVRTWNVNDVVRRQAMATPKAAPYFFARLPASYPPVRRLPAAHRPTQHALQEARP